MDARKTSLEKIESEYATLFLIDGRRQIDLILAYEDTGNDNATAERQRFIEALKTEGLELEIEDRNKSINGKLSFIKIYGPWKIMSKYAQELGIKLPLKTNDLPSGLLSHLDSSRRDSSPKYIFSSKRQDILTRILNHPVKVKALNYRYFASKKFYYNRNLIPGQPRYFGIPFHQNCENFFLIRSEEILSRNQRSFIVWEILNHPKFDNGIQSLLEKGIYTAAYPLHDGSCGKGKYQPGKEVCSDRRVLYSEWARTSQMHKVQPVSFIRSYFGDKVGFFFAWISFHMKMLIIPSLFGLFVIFYGLVSMNPEVPSEEICNIYDIGNETMCPVCYKYCPYWKLISFCKESKVAETLDNTMTIIFSFVITIWAFIFLKMWKRKEAVHAWNWDLSENPIYQSLNSFSHSNKKRNTRAKIGSILFLVMLLLDGIVSMIAFHISIIASVKVSVKYDFLQGIPIIVSVFASIFNVIIIVILEKFYLSLALWLVKFEAPLTQWDFENKLVFRAFLLQFLNMFTSLMYITFFRKKLAYSPIYKQSYSFAGTLGSDCSLDNCFLDVTIYLLSFILFKQASCYLSFLYCEVCSYLWIYWTCYKFPDFGEKLKKTSRWEKDYFLYDQDYNTLFYNEYKELALQFGFSTLFVITFPLAPLLILCFNLINLRLIASKHIRMFRLPVAFQVPNTGAWTTLLYGIAIFSVFTNAFLISFTSRFVPLTVYSFMYSCDFGSSYGYVNFTLSSFNVSQFMESVRPINARLENVTVCKYPRFQFGLDATLYKSSPEFLTVLYYRLALIVVFQYVVFGIGALIYYFIPDIPQHIQKKKLQELKLTHDTLIEFMLFQGKETIPLRHVHNIISVENEV